MNLYVNSAAYTDYPPASQRLQESQLTGNVAEGIAAAKALTAEYFKQRELRLQDLEETKKGLAAEAAEKRAEIDAIRQARLEAAEKVKRKEEEIAKLRGQRAGVAGDSGAVAKVDEQIAKRTDDLEAAKRALDLREQENQKVRSLEAGLEKNLATQQQIGAVVRKELEDRSAILQKEQEILRLKSQRPELQQAAAEAGITTAAAIFGGDIGRAVRAGAVDPAKFNEWFQKAKTEIDKLTKKTDLSSADIQQIRTLSGIAEQATALQRQFGFGSSALGERAAGQRAEEIAKAREIAAKRELAVNEKQTKAAEEDLAAAKREQSAAPTPGGGEDVGSGQIQLVDDPTHPGQKIAVSVGGKRKKPAGEAEAPAETQAAPKGVAETLADQQKPTVDSLPKGLEKSAASSEPLLKSFEKFVGDVPKAGEAIERGLVKPLKTANDHVQAIGKGFSGLPGLIAASTAELDKYLAKLAQAKSYVDDIPGAPGSANAGPDGTTVTPNTTPSPAPGGSPPVNL